MVSLEVQEAAELARVDVDPEGLLAFAKELGCLLDVLRSGDGADLTGYGNIGRASSTALPSMSGNTISKMIRSGQCLRASSSASAPRPAIVIS